MQRWARSPQAEDDVVVDTVVAPENSWNDVAEAEQVPPRKSVFPGLVAVVLALAWLGLIGWRHASSIGPGALETATDLLFKLISEATPPLILIAIGWAVATGGSRGAQARLSRISVGLVGEQARLDASMAHVETRLGDERAAIADCTDRLMRVGEDAADRLRALGDRLRNDIAVTMHDADALHRAAQAARSDITALLADLPTAQAQTVAMTGAIDAAGLAAHERAGALDAQIAALTARAREADEVAGGAAQKLAAHLARVDGASAAAAARLVEAADSMTTAIDSALIRAAEAGDAARQGMDAQGAAMRALVEQSDAALRHAGAEAGEALSTRVSDVAAALEGLGAALDSYARDGAALITDVEGGIARIDARFAAIDTTADARNARIGAALSGLVTHAEALSLALDRGGVSAESMIGRTETLMTALDAATHEVEESLPAALARLDEHAIASRAHVASLAPDVAKIEAHASAALDRLLDAEKMLADHHTALDALGDAADTRLAHGTAQAGALVAAVSDADRETRAIAEGAGATLVEAMMRVRETARAAADRAREALASVVPESADRLALAAREALSQAMTREVEARIGELTGTAERAVAAAATASDRLMRQMLTIAETSAQVEARIAEAQVEIDEADRETFTRRVALLIESLNSTAIDVTKILSNDVTDSAWGAYLKGDRGVFTRRAVRLLDAGEVREVTRHYDSDAEFRDQVNRYVHDFEAMLRNVLATRAGSPLAVTLLSSDMGKLYVALAQAIERLRG